MTPASAGGDPLDPHAQIVPGGLAGDRVGIGIGIAAVRRQQFGDQVVEQKALAELGRVGSEVPGAAALADRVPGPHRVRVDPVHQLGRHADPAVMARHPDPVVVGEAERPAVDPVHEQPVVAEDLPQPGILRVPGMVHLHRPLGQRVQREGGRGRSAPPRTACTRTAAGRNRSRSARGASPAAPPRHAPAAARRKRCSGST